MLTQAATIWPDQPWNQFCNLANDSVRYDRSGDYEVGVQRMMLAMGFNPQGIDGIYGTKTANAVYSYQTNAGLLGPPFGATPYVVDNPTWGQLYYDQKDCGPGGYGSEAYAASAAVSCTTPTYYSWDVYYSGLHLLNWYVLNKAGTTLVLMQVSGPS